MKQFFIIGNGGFAKEVMWLAERCIDTERSFGGFIDYNPETDSVWIGKARFKVYDEDVFLNDILPSGEVEIFVGLGNPLKVEQVIKKFNDYSFPNLVHPNVEMHGESIELGKGNIITAGCIFTVDIRIGSFNIFNLNTTVGHDTKIGNYNIINPGANISGSVTIGNSNLIGTNATILQGVIVGSRNKLGAACMVNKEVADDLIMVGVPAKPLKNK